MILLTRKQWENLGCFSEQELNNATLSESGFIGYCKLFPGAKCYLWQIIE